MTGIAGANRAAINSVLLEAQGAKSAIGKTGHNQCLNDFRYLEEFSDLG